MPSGVTTVTPGTHRRTKKNQYQKIKTCMKIKDSKNEKISVFLLYKTSIIYVSHVLSQICWCCL